MINQLEPDPSQLRWRCRRGMLELDLLLSTFVEMEYALLSSEEAELFSILLGYQDQALLDLLLGKMESSDAPIADLAARITRVYRDKFKS
jgi:antitoxin CptB